MLTHVYIVKNDYSQTICASLDAALGIVVLDSQFHYPDLIICGENEFIVVTPDREYLVQREFVLY